MDSLSEIDFEGFELCFLFFEVFAFGVGLEELDGVEADFLVLVEELFDDALGDGEMGFGLGDDELEVLLDVEVSLKAEQGCLLGDANEAFFEG